jgi:hypothetical protein
MSKHHPECPLYDDKNCKEANIPTVCAIVREDKNCLRKHRGRQRADGWEGMRGSLRKEDSSMNW